MISEGSSKGSDSRAFFRDIILHEESGHGLRKVSLNCTIDEKEQLNAIVWFVDMEPEIQADSERPMNS